MIRVPRTPAPPVLDLDDPDSPASREFEDARRWFVEGERGRQQRFRFQVFSRREVREALEAMFHGKCAYCESQVAAIGNLDVEHYRPKSSIVEAQDHPGYWWLAMDWSNLLVACQHCNQGRLHAGKRTGKANRFPLSDEATRAYHPGEETDEVPLILDPTGEDDPEDYFFYEVETGVILGESKRAMATIEILALNRKRLVERRREAALRTTALIDRVDLLARQGIARTGLFDEEWRSQLEQLLAELVSLTQPDADYAGLQRQLVGAFTEELDLPTATPLEVEKPKRKVTKTRTRKAKRSRKDYLRETSTYSLDTKEGRLRYREQVRAIESVSIRNIRALKKLDLDLTAGGAGHGHWLTLLGENGTGKSTVLQCIALALIGAEYFVDLANRQQITPRDFIRRRCRSGTIEVKITGFAEPHRLVFRKGEVEFHDPNRGIGRVTFDHNGASLEGNGWPPQLVLLAYGATRLLPSRTRDAEKGGDYARVENLFDPFQPLLGAKWISSLRRKDFDEAAIIVKDLLSLPTEAILKKDADGLLVNEHGHQVPVRQLSDGYQSVVALISDILEVAHRVWESFDTAEGIVLIDEIGAHLHPTWKMVIVERLRQALPGVQFIATTHHPLCLRGLQEDEVVVMRRAEDDPTSVYTVAKLPSPAEFRVDQLLTSEFFGLNSTVDPMMEALFDEYYALLALKDDLEPDQQERLDALRTELKDKRHLGVTLRDNLMYEAVDHIVANQLTADRDPLPDAKQAAIDQISAIWNTPVVEPGGDGDA